MKELEPLEFEKKSTFLLRYCAGFSIKRISQAMDCSEGTVKSRLFYTCKLLADRLMDYNPQGRIGEMKL